MGFFSIFRRTKFKADNILGRTKSSAASRIFDTYVHRNLLFHIPVIVDEQGNIPPLSSKHESSNVTFPSPVPSFQAAVGNTNTLNNNNNNSGTKVRLCGGPIFVILPGLLVKFFDEKEIRLIIDKHDHRYPKKNLFLRYL